MNIHVWMPGMLGVCAMDECCSGHRRGLRLLQQGGWLKWLLIQVAWSLGGASWLVGLGLR